MFHLCDVMLCSLRLQLESQGDLFCICASVSWSSVDNTELNNVEEAGTS